MPLRVILVSKTLLGVGMRTILEQTSDCEVLVPPTCEPEDFATLIQRSPPDVSILDATSLDVLAWFEGLGQHQIAHLGASIVIDSAPLNEETFFLLMKWGCFACLKATASNEDLITTVQKVGQGECLLTSEDITNPLPSLSTIPQPVSDFVPLLSSREVEVVYLIAMGKSNKEIGRFLSLSDQTVKNHITRIFIKLNVQDRTEAVVCALRKQLILLPGFPVPIQTLATAVA